MEKDWSLEESYQQALRFLAPRFLSRYELRQKLERKGIPTEFIDEVETRLLSVDYLNDQRLASQVTQFFVQQRRYGLYHIRQKMKQRGLLVDSDVADTYEEQEVARELVNKKFNSIGTLQEVSRNKVIRFLTNRGFSTGTIQGVLGNLDIF